MSDMPTKRDTYCECEAWWEIELSIFSIINSIWNGETMHFDVFRSFMFFWTFKKFLRVSFCQNRWRSSYFIQTEHMNNRVTHTIFSFLKELSYRKIFVLHFSTSTEKNSLSKLVKGKNLLLYNNRKWRICRHIITHDIALCYNSLCQ